MQVNAMEKAIKLPDVSKRTGIGSVTLINQIKAGRLKGAKIGKFWWIREGDLSAFLSEQFDQGKTEKQAA